jgi:hypothetical protein
MKKAEIAEDLKENTNKVKRYLSVKDVPLTL